MALDEFLVKNDPCRGKADTSAERNLLLRDTRKLNSWKCSTLCQTAFFLLPSTQFLLIIFFSLSVLIFSVLSEFTLISSSITSPLHPDLFPTVVVLYAWPSHLAHSLYLPVILWFFSTIVVHDACSLGLSLPLSLPHPLSLFLSPQCNIQDLKSCVLTPAAPYHLAQVGFFSLLLVQMFFFFHSFGFPLNPFHSHFV